MPIPLAELGYIPPEEEYVEPVAEPLPAPPPEVVPTSFGPAPIPEAVAQEQAPAPPPEQAPAGPIQGVVDQVGGFVQENIVDPIADQVPAPIKETVGPPLSGLGGAIGEVGEAASRVADKAARLDPGGVVGEVINLTLKPQEESRERAIGGVMRGEPMVPGIQDIIEDPGEIVKLPAALESGVGGLAMGEDIPAFIAANPDEAQEAYDQGGATAVRDRWAESHGLTTTPTGVDAPWDDEEYSGDMRVRLGQVVNELGQTAGSIKDSAQAGTLTPFLKNMALELIGDPLLPAQIGLSLLTGGLGAAAPALSRISPVLGSAARAGTRIGRLTNEGINVVSGDPTPIVGAMTPAPRTIKNIAGATDLAPEGLIARGQDVAVKNISEALTARNVMNQTPSGVAPASPVTPGAGSLLPPNGSQALPDLSQPGIAQPVRPRASNTLFDPPGVVDTPRTLPASTRPNPYLRGTSPVTPTTPVRGAPVVQKSPRNLVSPTTGRAITPRAAPVTRSVDSIGVQRGTWVDTNNIPLVRNGDISPEFRAKVDRIYNEMLTADADTFWSRFDSAGPRADVRFGDDGFYARYRGAMRQGNYLLDDWPEGRVLRQNLPKNAQGGIDWPIIEQRARSGNETARKALAGKRSHDLYVNRISRAANPDEEVYNLLHTYQSDMHSGRFSDAQYGSQYWRQRAEGIAEILRDSHYTLSPELRARLAATPVQAMVRGDFPRATFSRGLGPTKTLLNDTGDGLVLRGSNGQPYDLTTLAGPPPLSTVAPDPNTVSPPSSQVPPLAPASPQLAQTFNQVGIWSPEARAALRNIVPPNAVPGFHDVPMSADAMNAMMETIPVNFRNGERVTTKPMGQISVETWDELNELIDYETGVLPIASAPARHQKLLDKFTSPEYPMDFKHMGGAGNIDGKNYLKTNLVSGVIADAMQRAAPKAAKDASRGVIGTVLNANKSWLRARSQIQLFNVMNVPRYALQNVVGNTIMTAITFPKAVPSMLRSFGHWMRSSKVVRGTVTDEWDDVQSVWGMGTLSNVNQVDKAQLGRLAAGKLPPAKTGVEKFARIFMNDTATAHAQVGDLMHRRMLALTATRETYGIMNKTMPRIMREHFQGLPFTDRELTRSWGRFLDQHRLSIDPQTGLPRKNMLGRTMKVEPVWDANKIKPFLREDLRNIRPDVDTVRLNQAIDQVHKDALGGTQIARRNAENMVSKVAFKWYPTNVSEFASQLVMFPYWTSKAGALYVKTALSHPVMISTYGRMMEEMEMQLEVMGGVDWMRGFFRAMNSPAGMSIWYNPFDLLSTLFTFAEWQGDAGLEPKEYDDLTAVGEKRAMAPLLLNPMLDTIAAIMGVYGPDAKIPDFLGINRLANNAADFMNLLNANDMLPGNMGKDAFGNKIPFPARPLQELYASAATHVSRAIEPLMDPAFEAMGLEFQPLRPPPPDGSWHTNFNYFLEQGARIQNPNADSDTILQLISDAKADPGHPLSEYAYGRMAEMPYEMSDDFLSPLPDWLQNSIGGVIRAISPIQIQANSEQMMIDRRMKGLPASGTVPPRYIEEGDEFAYDNLKDAASQTVEGQDLAMRVDEHYEGLDLAGMGAINKSWKEIAYAGTVNPYTGEITPFVNETITIAGETYTQNQIMALPQGQRYDLADAYLNDQGTSPEALDQYKDSLKTYNEGIRDPESELYDPELVGFLDWQGATRDGGVNAVYANMEANPAYAQYVMDNAINPDGTINTKYATNEDAYLTSMGIKPSVYSPAVLPPTTSPAVIDTHLNDPVQNQVTPTAELNFRASPDVNSEAIHQVEPGVPMSVIEPGPEWTKVALGPDVGYVATAYLQKVDGGQVAPAPAQDGGILGALGGMATSVADAVGGAINSVMAAPHPTTLTSYDHTIDPVNAVDPNRGGKYDPNLLQVIDVSTYQSPNYHQRPAPPVGIAYHFTAGSDISGFEDVFMGRDPNRKASANYVVDKDGTIYQFVHPDQAAWTHGDVQDPRTDLGTLNDIMAQGYNPNDLYIGIEVVNEGDRENPGTSDPANYAQYTPEQLAAVQDLTNYLVDTYGIAPARDTLIAHSDINSVEKRDPGPLFPLDEIIYGAGGEVDPALAQPAVGPTTTTQYQDGGPGMPTLDWLGGLTGQYDEAVPTESNDIALESTPLVESGWSYEGTPEEYIPIIEQAASESGVPAPILDSLLWAESQYDPNAVSPAGAQGIAQFMPETAAGYGIDPLDPEQAIPAAARYLADAYAQFGSWELALAAYNAGGGNVEKYGGIPPFAETQAYVPKIMTAAGMG